MPHELGTALPTIALTVGDPSGIGPEIVLKAVNDHELACLAQWVIIGDARVLKLAGRLSELSPADADIKHVASLESLEDFEFGRLDARYGQAAAEYVRVATELCLAKRADAMVTAPLNKEAVTMSGREFSGHTEYIAELCGATESRMLLSSRRLSTVHVSTHVPLRRACDLSVDRIVRTIELGDQAMKLLSFARPKVAVCGLNPHAGEHGLFGTEDQELVFPAIDACRTNGIDCSGPYPADTIFLQASRGMYDLVVAMYHDQGHIAMKLLDFEGTVNISLGIPITRTSVDHGTAFDIAGKNRADAGSMKEAMRVAAQMATARKRLAAAEKYQ